MTALMAERTKHDPSWRGVESAVRHGLASAGVELAAERASVATVAQARRKVRFVGIGCLHCDPEARVASANRTLKEFPTSGM
jgi:hypothetical protein